jgi:putative membrane protein
MNTTRIAKGALAGALGGLAGTYAMNQFQQWWSHTVHNEIAAQTAPVHTIGRPLDRGELNVGATAVHFGFGAAMGGLYGAFYEISPATRKMGGAAFGTTVWAAADEVAVPMLGLSGPTTEHPPARHVHAFAAHIVFGVTTEVVRRGVRALLNGKRPRRPA